MLAEQELETRVPNDGPISVLCVDDDVMGLISRRLLLERFGCEVRVAASAQAAVRILRQQRVDIVVTDHLLPGMSGTELLQEVRLLDPFVPVMILTGVPDPIPGAEQADCVLIKGVDPHTFLNQVAQLAMQGRRKRAGAH